MKKIYFLVIFCFSVSIFTVNSQSFVVDDGKTIEELANMLTNEEGMCESATPSGNSGLVNGSSDATPIDSFGSFTASNNPNFNLTEGVVLSTGSASQAGATTVRNEGTAAWGGSASYENALGLPMGSTVNATEMEFDFIALQNNIGINYVFASNEYASVNVCTSNEGMVILIKEKDAPDTSFENIAMVPGTNLPVTVSNLHSAQVGCPDANGDLIRNGRGVTSLFPNYSLYSDRFVANTASEIGKEYTVKIIISDENPNFDSSAFIGKIDNELAKDLKIINEDTGIASNIGEVSVCGTSVTLTTDFVFPDSEVTYEWSPAGSSASDQSTFEVTTSGLYTLNISVDGSMCSKEVNVQVNLGSFEDGNVVSPVCQSLTDNTYDLTTTRDEVIAGRTDTSVEFFDDLDIAKNNTSVGLTVAESTSYVGNADQLVYARLIEPGGCIYISAISLTAFFPLNNIRDCLFLKCDSEVFDNRPGMNKFVVDGNASIEESELTDFFFEKDDDGLFNFNGDTTQGIVRYFNDDQVTPFTDSVRKTFTPLEETLYVQFTPIDATGRQGCSSQLVPFRVGIERPATGVIAYDRDEIDKDGIAIVRGTDTSGNPIPRLGFVFGNIHLLEPLVKCDDDANPADKLTDFDLTERTITADEPINVTYYTTLAGLNKLKREGTNILIEEPIDVTMPFRNRTTPQLIFVRIESTRSLPATMPGCKENKECAIFRAFELKSNHLLTDNAEALENEDECGDASGIATFDLLLKKKCFKPEFTVEFYEDAALTTLIPDSELAMYQNKTNPQTIYVSIADDDPICEITTSFDLSVRPFETLNLQNATPLEACGDINGRLSGLVSLFDSTVRDEITGGSGLGLLYFRTEPEALDELNGVPITNMTETPISNVSIELEYWARGTSANNCATVNVVPITLTVHPEPGFNAVPPIFVCDDSSTLAPVNITQNLNSAIPGDRSKYNITYYLNLNERTKIVPRVSSLISSPETFDTTLDRDDTVWIRVENKVSGCVSIIPQQIIRTTSPIIPNNIDFLVCVDNISAGTDFNLQSRDAIILGGSTGSLGKTVRYWDASLQDAIDGNAGNELDKTVSTRSTVPQRTIYFRVENDANLNCFTTGEFLLKIEQNPAPLTISRVDTCDDSTLDDALDDIGRASFDLDEVRAGIIGAEANSTASIDAIEFFDQEESNSGMPPIGAIPLASPYRNKNAESQVIIAKITNSNGCITFQSFLLVVRERPTIEPIAPIEVCGTLGDAIPDIVNIEQDPATDFVFRSFLTPPILASANPVQYYRSEEDRGMDRNEITDLTNFEVTDLETTIYIKINYNTGCDFDSSFKVILNPLPVIIPRDIIECEATLGSNSFVVMLEGLNDEYKFVDPKPADVEIQYFSDNSATPTQINGSFTKTTSVNEIYARTINTTTGCVSGELIRIPLVANPLPILTNLPLIRKCDEDGANDGLLSFTPEIKAEFDALVLSTGQSAEDFVITYHDDQLGADNDTPLANPGILSTNEYFVKVTSALGCASVTPFNLEVNQIPILTLSDVTFCKNDPTININGRTGNPEDDSYTWTFRTGDELAEIIRTVSSEAITVGPLDVDTVVTLEVMNSITGCPNSASFRIDPSESPVISINDIVRGFDIGEFVITTSTVGDYTYGLADASDVSNTPPPRQDSNVFKNVVPGKYVAWVFDENGCDPGMKEFTFIDYFPYFTPNGSGPIETETWHLIGIEEIPEAIVYVYDRYGKLLKTLTSNSTGWDGTYNGVPVPTDDYWVVIELGDGEQLKDHITLKR